MKWRIVCRRCDRTIRVPLGVKMHWHHCEPKRGPRYRWEFPSYADDGLNVEERRAELYRRLRGKP